MLAPVEPAAPCPHPASLLIAALTLLLLPAATLIEEVFWCLSTVLLCCNKYNSCVARFQSAAADLLGADSVRAELGSGKVQDMSVSGLPKGNQLEVTKSSMKLD